MAASALRAFAPSEIVLCAVFGVLLEALLIAGIVLSGNSTLQVRRHEEPQEIAVPIAVQPVLDDLPLLKLGSKKDKLKPRLPDMWRKREPVPVRRLEERSAPSEKAEDRPDEIPESEIADPDHPAPDEDDEVVKEVDQTLEEEPEEEAPELNEEGDESGAATGTEADPLKARAVDLYRMKLQSWFSARFDAPKGEIPCEVLRGLSATLVVQVGPDRSVASASITSPSGNAVFDGRVQAAISAMTGRMLPPPPELYPDILSQTLTPRLTGSIVCADE